MHTYLQSDNNRARYMRMDTAAILKRFHFCEHAMITAQAGWLAGIPLLDAKITLSKHLWQDSLTGDELRNRVFELRYPSRLLEVGADAPIVDIFAESINAPNAFAFLKSLLTVYKPQLLAVYRSYLTIADAIADGPSIRFLTSAITDKEEQLEHLHKLVVTMEPMVDAADQSATEVWLGGLKARIEQVGALSLDSPTMPDAPLPLPARTPFAFAEAPARDSRFHLCRFYWPNVIEPNFPYGEGVTLQLRSAVSHLNEVWAIESAGAVLHALADMLGWQFIMDAARWTYDEARHTKMGWDRLTEWGYSNAELPLGTYIYDSAKGQSPVVRLGFLHYFETLNIGKKNERAEAFASYEDSISQHDMEFDWADETIHAHYGRKWLDVLEKQYPDITPERSKLLEQCKQLVEEVVASAQDSDRQDILEITNAMIDKANQRIEQFKQ